ncbi:MAG: copper resistance protein B [Pseudomonadota bacterium]
MKTLITLATLLAAAPAIAQHQGHDEPAPQEHGEHAAPTEDSHADHGMMGSQHNGHAEDQDDDTHAGHHMMDEDEGEPDHSMHHAGPDDPPMDHSGHQMDALQSSDPHQGHDMGLDTAIPQSGPPPEAFTGPDHAADTVFPPEAMAEARAALPPELGGGIHRFFGIDRLEAQIADGEDAYVWELNAWYGGDIDKLWIKSEGEGEFGGPLEEAEIQALWSHAIGPYFDVQAGVRYDIRPEPDRAHAVLGIQGLAPYFFEIDVAGFLSDEGDLTARIEAEYDQRITQKLILQPRVELNLSAQDIPELGIGSGLSDLEAGLRLRYEFVPEFAPYVGVEWQRQFGDTADFTRAAGGDSDRIVFLAGVKLWF